MKWIACVAMAMVTCAVGVACDSGGGADSRTATQTPSVLATILSGDLSDEAILERAAVDGATLRSGSRVSLCAISDSDPCPSPTPPVMIGWPILRVAGGTSHPQKYYVQDSTPDAVAVYSVYADPELVLVQQPATLSVPPFMSESPDGVRKAGLFSVNIWERSGEIWARFETGATSDGVPIIGLVDADASNVSEDGSCLSSLRSHRRRRGSQPRSGLRAGAPALHSRPSTFRVQPRTRA